MKTRSPYRILGQIGQGQFGRVFCGLERSTGKIVALKYLELQSFPTQKFLRELYYIFTLRHPNIVSCNGLQYDRQGRYMIMEYCQGGTLRDLMNSPVQLSLVKKLQLVEDILRGLAYAHRHQVIHCDVKPENILLNITSGGWIARLTDFGIARLMEETYMNKAGGYTGSPAYMAPERYYGQHSYACDLYAVGIILYEFWVGERPFSGYPGELMTSHMSKTVTIPATVPEKIAPIIETALRKLPQRRFASTEAMLSAIREVRKELEDPASTYFLPPVDVLIYSAVKILHQLPLEKPVTHLAVSPEYLYLGREDQLVDHAYSEGNFPDTTTAQGNMSLSGEILDLFPHSQGCVSITRSLASQSCLISFFPKPSEFWISSQQFRLQHLEVVSTISPQGNWLAIATPSFFKILTVGELVLSEAEGRSRTMPGSIRLKRGLNFPFPSQLMPLDNNHGLAVFSHPEKTDLKLFNRRGQVFNGMFLPLVLSSIIPNPYLPYHLFAVEDKDKFLGVFIQLKPLKITRIVLPIRPDFKVAYPQGYLVANREGNIVFINFKGEGVAQFEMKETITAIALFNSSQFLVATQSNQGGMLYFCALPE